MALIASFSWYTRAGVGGLPSRACFEVDRATGALPPAPAVYPVVGMFRDHQLEHDYQCHLVRSSYKQLLLVSPSASALVPSIVPN